VIAVVEQLVTDEGGPGERRGRASWGKALLMLVSKQQKTVLWLQYYFIELE
jgi:hypothetical protein